MRLTSFTDYTLRVLIYLGVHRNEGRLATISDIAAAYGISPDHLRKIVHHLAKQGCVETTRGKGGGMRLARPPANINVGEVVRGAEEDMALVACFENAGAHCPIDGTCELQQVLRRALDAFLAVLDQHTLADLIEPQSRLIRIFRSARP